MAKQRNRTRREVTEPTPFEMARDELFQHIMQCGVIGADEQHQTEWFNETIGYLGERFHELTPEQIGELRTLGERFAKPPKKSQGALEQEQSASAA
jgi:hypothetical protein